MSSDGGNKRTKESTKEKSTRHHQRRRRSSANTTTVANNNSSAPKPTPPPPESLVKLIKSDPSVLSYFQSLQSNLDFDVQQWKERATRYRDKCRQLESQLLLQQNKKKKKTTATASSSSKKRSPPRSTNGGVKEAKTIKKAKGNSNKDEEKYAISSTPEQIGKGGAAEVDLEGKEKEKHQQDAAGHDDGGVAIDDSMLDDMFSSSSSDDDEEGGGDKEDDNNNGTIIPAADIEPTSTDVIVDTEQQRLSMVYQQLVEAYKSLELLGIEVVSTKEPIINEADREEKERKEDEENLLGSGEINKPTATNEESLETDTTCLIRREDSDVVADLVHAIKSLTQIQIPPNVVTASAAASYLPFLTSKMIPCCYDVTQFEEDAGGLEDDEEMTTFNVVVKVRHHPAVDGLAHAFRALSIMDIYCCPTAMSDNEWNDIFRAESNISKVTESIRYGMRGRQFMVEAFIESLHGEISNEWGFLDRSLRLITTSLHFEPDDGTPVESYDDKEEERIEKSIISAKRQSRLSSLIERCMYAQLVSNFYHHQQNTQEAVKLVWEYILATTPATTVEDYPKMPPVLSLCILEALLRRNKTLLNIAGTTKKVDWCSTISCRLSCNGRDGGGNNTTSSLVNRVIALSIHTTAQIWKQRSESSDDRISDTSRVEVACYERLVDTETFQKASALNECQESAMSIVKEALDVLCPKKEDNSPNDEALLDGNEDLYHREERKTLDASLALQLALVIGGDSDIIQETFKRAVNAINELNCAIGTAQYMSFVRCCALAVSCCVSFRQIQIRQIDTFRLMHGALHFTSNASRQPSIDVTGMIKVVAECYQSGEVFWTIVTSIARCCLQLADGERAHSLVQLMVRLNNENDKTGLPTNGTSRKLFIDATAALLKVGQIPTIRVINLHRRTDRMKTFLAQAQQFQLLVVRSVAKFLDTDDVAHNNSKSTQNDFPTDEEHYFWGGHAFDGQGRALEVHKRLSKGIGDSRKLDDFVSTHWRPNDLSAFDKDAREDEALVRISSSEKACALSHIASWKGAARSLSVPLPSQQQASQQGSLFRHPHHLLRLFRISGFARGKPLLHENESMPPSPVCVILEDDAVLVDRFVERLSSLLDELPRDFHFCSLGYSRPKTAPILNYSSQVGIPSCLWYLTGYVISLDGAKYLLDNLPVRGPVDSWIGLKMCANWDNVFGQRLGVGDGTRPSVTAPSRKDLSTILRFRAFCALVPLCSQKVGLGRAAALADEASTPGRRSWKQLDTDITYSGNQCSETPRNKS